MYSNVLDDNYSTVIVPRIVGWRSQRYEYVPFLVKMCSNVCPTVMNGPVSVSGPFIMSTLWLVPSNCVHRMVSPARTVIVGGRNEKSRMETSWVIGCVEGVVLAEGVVAGVVDAGVTDVVVGCGEPLLWLDSLLAVLVCTFSVVMVVVVLVGAFCTGTGWGAGGGRIGPVGPCCGRIQLDSNRILIMSTQIPAMGNCFFIVR